MNTSSASIPLDPSNSNWLAVVKSKVEALDYGVVTIVVHNRLVTQIESTEKLRLEQKIGGSGTTKPKS